MRFFCPELEGLTLSDLIAQEASVYYQSPRDDYQTVTGWFRQLARVFTRRGQDSFGYANESFQPLTGTFPRSLSLQTVAAFAAARGVTITDNTGLTDSYAWACGSWNQLRSGFWFTVFAEDGIYLMPPYRTGDYRGAVSETDIVGRTSSALTVSYNGESGYDLTISADVEFIRPAIVDSELKSAAVNKFRARQDVITFQSAGEWPHGDWVQYQTASYVILSRRSVLQDDRIVQYIYTAVKECTDSNTFSAADEIPQYDNTSALQITTVSTTAAYTIGGWEQYLRYTGAGNASWTLPAASGSGRRFVIKHQGNGVLTVSRAGSDVIDRVDTRVQCKRDTSYTLTDAASTKWEVN